MTPPSFIPIWYAPCAYMGWAFPASDFLARLVAELGLPFPAVSPAPPLSLSGARRSVRQSRPPARLSPPHSTPARHPGRERRPCTSQAVYGAGRDLATAGLATAAVRSELYASAPAATVSHSLPPALCPSQCNLTGRMGNNPSSSTQSSEGAVPQTPPPHHKGLRVRV